MIKKIIIPLFLIIVIGAVAFLGYIWYHTFDVSGLVFYEDTPIKDIIVHFDKLYFVTEDGKGYVAGGYSTSEERKYRNAEFQSNESLGGAPSPVLFFDGIIDEIFTCEDKDILFIDNNNDLYKLNEINAVKIAEGIVSAAKLKSTDVVYAVDNLHNLFIVGEKQILSSSVKSVKTCGDKIFVLCDNGDLCELINGTLALPIFSSVKNFEAVDTSSVIFDGEKFILDDEETSRNPLINVLTSEGELYAKGSYNLIYKSYMKNQNHQPHKLDDWSLIGQNVKDFSLAGMGTIMAFEDNTCAYYGFDTTYETNSTVEYRTFDINNVESVSATNCHISINTSDGFYFLGNQFHMFFDKMSDKHHILTGTPYFLD